jgi:DNA-binding NtrC family response regulator
MSGHSAGFDLILSDIVLPDGRGTDLVAELLESNPDLNALFVTGYADVSLGWQRVADSEFPVLRKPLDVVKLLDRVRDALRPPAS